MAERDGDDKELHARLDALKGALKSQRKQANEPLAKADKENADSTGSAMALGMRAASEFAAAVIVGGLIGWLLDRELGTKPAFSLIFFLLGVVAGIWNVIRATSPLSRAKPTDKDGRRAAPEAAKPSPTGADDDED
jgi:ATP synthase protein I